MTEQFNPQLIASLKSFARAASGFTISIGCAVLVGWILDVSLLKSALPGLVAMKVNTAIAFVLAGVSLWLLLRGRLTRRACYIAQVCALVTGAIGLLTLSQYLFSWNFGIDQLLFHEQAGVVGTSPPGRMAPNAALSFLMVGSALLLLANGTNRSLQICSLLAVAAGLIAFLALVGYLYGFTPLYGIGPYTQMALHTALGFTALGLGMLFAHADRGMAAIITQDRAGSSLARRLLPAAIVVPLLLGWLRLEGQRAGLYSSELGLALLALTTTVIFGALLSHYATLQNREARERMRAEEELKREHDQLVQLNKELEAFSYSVSHDLRAPLRSIGGFSEALLEDYEKALDDQGKDYLSRVCRATEHMSGLIDGMLSLSRVNRREIAHEQVNLSEIAREAALQLKGDAPDRDVEFVIAEDQVAEGDPTLLRSVVQNLFDNAWKYTSSKPQAHIEFGSVAENGKRVFFVKDDGIGFDQSQTGRLFTPFQRLHEGEGITGTGIGLATVQRIVHRHGGHVWAEGEPGHGARIQFTLR